MPIKKQIWFYRGSRASSLAQLLRRRYALRQLGPETARGRNSRRSAKPNTEDAKVPAVWLVDLENDDLSLPRTLAKRQASVRLIGVTASGNANGGARRGIFACLPRSVSRTVLEQTVAAAFETIELEERERTAREDLARAERETEELNRFGVMLSETHDVGVLLKLILAKAREITGADAGALYLVEEARGDADGSAAGEPHLRLKLTQNDSRQFPFTEYWLPVREDSMAGYAAMRGEAIAMEDAYSVPRGLPYRLNLRYDEETGYRTKSIVTLPMKNGRGKVLGVLQLINCKRHREVRLMTAEDLEREAQPFPERAIRMALSLASQAAVAYENSKLYQDIETLFEGFVQAAVTAIEQRDPTTSGHSHRVSTMTVGLAEIVDRTSAGPYAETRFTPGQMKEIRYAALLHDFGKVGVREEVLVKAKKLYPAQISVLQNRFDYVRKDLEARTEKKKFRAVLESQREEALSEVQRLDRDLERRLTELDEAFGVIQRANEPSLLPAGQFDRLFEIARLSYRDPRGAEHPLLTPDEVRLLSIPRGSLDSSERQQIESHVVHSFNFLMQIPWTKEISQIPSIARAHHEKLNGTGYPYRLKGVEIPVQARMMTICDIFDALSAADRPYKKAVPAERALAILESAVRESELDPELFKLFIDAKIFQLSLRPS
ncbi:MAG TPA: HD domain-containing phosphohydrolase [Methylomirabilota bacterium]|nr:HD domain-containing phosphohydrolase [Methylomirabilota bacterium]